MDHTPYAYIFLRMREGAPAGEPEVYLSYEEAQGAFEEYTGVSWEDVESLSEEAGADPDEILGIPFAGSRILPVELPHQGTLPEAA